ncbi:cell division protein CrgA [Streptomyces sp. YIM 98790]|uniref:cell division protein CrgA n=1 Tax=Streptomyces sp. YIM 98790 TaxID=2689077 RepID=UPI001407C978|nr:cell division protein CrgA [Streptomyces sp. YIM 98790]
MPISRIRKKKDGTPANRSAAQKQGGEKRTPTKLDMVGGRRWVAPLMLALFVLGLCWIVVFYITQGDLPVKALGNWNIVVGFGFIAGGFVVSTQWK